MNQLVTVIITIFYITWLLAVLVLLWLVWRNGVTRSQRLEEALVDATLTTAKAASKTAEAVWAMVQEQNKNV